MKWKTSAFLGGILLMTGLALLPMVRNDNPEYSRSPATYKNVPASHAQGGAPNPASPRGIARLKSAERAQQASLQDVLGDDAVIHADSRGRRVAEGNVRMESSEMNIESDRLRVGSDGRLVAEGAVRLTSPDQTGGSIVSKGGSLTISKGMKGGAETMTITGENLIFESTKEKP